MAADHVMAASPQKGIFRFDEKTNRFIPDFTLGKEFADGSRGVFRIIEDWEKNIWFHSNRRNLQAIPKSNAPNSFIIKSKPFLRLSDTQVNVIYPEPGGGGTWFGRDDGLIRFVSKTEKNYRHTYLTIIRRVIVNGKTLVYYPNKDKTGKKLKRPIPVFQYRDRNISFEYAAPFFEAENATVYRSLLQGYDES
ncbi:MAG: hypothetical protein GY757_46310, partial [bacterium]|nr:hypothetical protein [bacterium]